MQKVVEQLKNLKLINSDDIAVYCIKPKAFMVKKSPKFILAANNREIKIFNLDNVTGEYLGTYTLILMNDVKKAKVGMLKFNADSVREALSMQVSVLFSRDLNLICKKVKIKTNDKTKYTFGALYNSDETKASVKELKKLFLQKS